MWELLRPQIRTLLQTLSTFSVVEDAPTLDFSGYPAAYVIPSTNSADYETNKENIRTYAFIVRIFYETKNTGVGASLSALEKMVDSVIDLFDREDMKTVANRVVAVNLPADYTFINIWATPANWSEIPEKQLIMAEISVRVRMSIDIS